MKKDKYIWWGLLGIGVAAFFYFLSKREASPQQAPVQVPYLVPSTAASPSAGSSLSDQPNIVGSSPNSTIPNYQNSSPASANFAESVGSWPLLPNLHQQYPIGIKNQTFTSGSGGPVTPSWNLDSTRLGQGYIL